VRRARSAVLGREEQRVRGKPPEAELDQRRFCFDRDSLAAGEGAEKPVPEPGGKPAGQAR
jgi:hypothetical protein